MSVIIGGLTVALQSGGIFNHGEIVLNCTGSNIHQEAAANSFCVGDGNFFYGYTNQPSVSANGIVADIIDGKTAEAVHGLPGFQPAGIPFRRDRDANRG